MFRVTCFKLFGSIRFFWFLDTEAHWKQVRRVSSHGPPRRLSGWEVLGHALSLRWPTKTPNGV